jgi:hypothetical protein
MSENQTFLERRNHSRKPVKIPVQYRLVEDPKELEGLRGKTALAKDLSLDGMYIKTPKGASVGDVIRLDISMPENSRHLFAFAEVVWSNPKGAGVRLMLMAVEDKESLQAYLDKVPAK